MHGPLDLVLDRPAEREEELVLLTTDPASGTVTGAIALGAEWELLLREVVVDVGRRAQLRARHANV